MLVPVDKLNNPLLDAIFDDIKSTDCRFRCLDLMESLDYEKYDLFLPAIEAAKEACFSLNIPIGYHFKTIFISDGKSVNKEYMFSHLACYLITLNADSSIPAVARAQLYFLSRR